jgi:hypothetical protein
MSEILSPFSKDVRVSKNVHIMVKSCIAKIFVDKQAYVVKNNCVIHNKEFFAAIEPNLVTWILPRFLDLN